MIRLKAENGPGVSLPDLSAWCSNNSFWCNLVTNAIPLGGVGAYLKKLMR